MGIILGRSAHQLLICSIQLKVFGSDSTKQSSTRMCSYPSEMSLSWSTHILLLIIKCVIRYQSYGLMYLTVFTSLSVMKVLSYSGIIQSTWSNELFLIAYAVSKK